ncbi:hypothetical protein AVEN_7677-1 [Araneus ventricosus]|uniref:Uncharacterized protein n=1 Tax=Araneus ventricosus TaxID=182803 RepID=A0A4Y2K7W2_ARAVE|nr:hypothetical protein AVEN_7677-1 [Araneus ventricosus]
MATKEQIVVINRKRGSLKSSITKLASFVTSANSKDRILCETKLENLQKIKVKLGEVKNEYFEIVEDKDLEALENSVIELEEECERLEVSLKTILTSSNKIAVSTNKDGNNSESLSESVHIRLPEIPLPKFSGQYQDWQNFKMQFENIIDSNDKWTDNQKLFYLKSTLSGAAAEIVTLDDSYSSLFKTLTDRFDNKRLICNSYFNEIISLDMPIQDSAKSLRQFVDSCQKHIRALKTIGLELNEFAETLLINIMIKKLDKESRRQFELSLVSSDLPKWSNFIDFLEKRCLMLENIQSNVTSKPKLQSDMHRKSHSFFVKGDSKYVCIACKNPHPHLIFKCRAFLKLDPLSRLNLIKNTHCTNCLSNTHKIHQCFSDRKCKHCMLSHNSLLHINSNSGIKRNKVNQNAASLSASNQQNENCKVINSETQCDLSVSLHSKREVHSRKNKTSALLPTIIVYIKNASNERIPVTALCDSGSENSFLSYELANSLGLKKNKINASISGINGSITQIYSKVLADISNGNESYRRQVELLVIPKITDFMPSQDISIEELNLPSGIILADPKLGQPHKIDMLLSASFLFDIIEAGKYTTDKFIFQNSKFGFIASSNSEGNFNHKFCGLVTQNEPIDDLIQLFWEIETINENNCSLSEEAIFCEEHFKSTHKRNSEGRYIVEMAIKEFPPLGESKQIAQKRLDSLIRRLEKNPHMKKLYSEFMEEYETLGHMERVVEDELPSDNYYLPHHGVYKSGSTTTPLRVVFNASSPSSNGVSLNDILLKGDVVEDIFELMLRFRQHKFAFTFDVQKMFRQILVAPHQRDYLRILWFEDNTCQPITFKLNTITYGTACAPFYAIRTVKQLAIDESSEFPLASEIALRDIYMDDGITGTNDVKTAQILQTQLIDMFAKGGMNLHKWTSNSLELLNSFPSSNQERAFPIDAHVSKTLGMNWLHLDDYFIFKVDCKHVPNPTKRNVLSVIARLYDPLGLLGPVICKMKIFLQKLWLEKLSFDDPLPQPIAVEWNHLVSSLKTIELIKIPRWILADSSQKLVLHCFSDSSQAAYGAVIYLQCVRPDDTSTAKLVASKSRVSPLKTVSIPRLELCGCLLAAQLKAKVEHALNLQIDSILMYTDSTISLAWIQTSPHRLKTFVANRVVKIQRLTQNCEWQHVPSNLNPADVFSRGLVPEQLIEHNLWWNGPPFLQEPVPVNCVDQQLADTSTDTRFLCELKNITSPNDFNAFFNDFKLI